MPTCGGGRPRPRTRNLHRLQRTILIAVALHRLIIGEVSRFPALGDVVWRDVSRYRLATEQFISLVRGEIQLGYLLRLEAETGQPSIRDAVAAAVSTFMLAFERRATVR